MFESFGNRIGGVDKGSKLASLIDCSPVVPKVSQAHGTRNRTSRSAGLTGKTKTLRSLRKVYGGTPVGNESRCDTCVYARIIQGYAESERIVFCTSFCDPLRLPFKVMQCSDYEDRRLPSYSDMKGMAWEINRRQRPVRKAGFVEVEELVNSSKEEE